VCSVLLPLALLLSGDVLLPLTLADDLRCDVPLLGTALVFLLFSADSCASAAANNDDGVLLLLAAVLLAVALLLVALLVCPV
jgi:hypothetical protein